MLCRVRRPGRHESRPLQVLHGDGEDGATADRTRTSRRMPPWTTLPSIEYDFEGPDCTLFIFVCGNEREQPRLAQVDATVKGAWPARAHHPCPRPSFVAMNDDPVEFDTPGA